MKNKQNYQGSFENLILVCLLGWDYCTKYLKQFETFKSVYTDKFIQENLDKVKKVKDLADLNERNLTVKNLRFRLEQSAGKTLHMWQDLKVYITAAFPKSQLAAQLRGAGSESYRYAATFNRNALSQLISDAGSFISKYNTELSANNNMPANFPAAFNTTAGETLDLIKTLIDFEVNKSIEAGDKLQAANDIYADLTAMTKDGQAIFRNNPLLKKQFVYSALLQKVKGNSSAKLRGYVFITGTKTPVADALVSSSDGKYKATTEKDGRFLIDRIAGGTYTMHIEKSGYQPFEIVVEVKAGIINKLDATITPAEQLLKVA